MQLAGEIFALVRFPRDCVISRTSENGPIDGNYIQNHHVVSVSLSLLWNRQCLISCVLRLLVFSKCFRAEYFTFSQLKFKVNKGINT